MARIEWVKQRLENWSRWYLQRESGGLGYPSQTAFARLAAHGSRAENVIPIDNIEASITDDAVQSMQFTHPHLHVTLRAFYIDGVGVNETARRVQRARSTVLGHLALADQVLSAWFNARARQREKSFTA